MQSFFLNSLAKYFYQLYGTAISDFCFVFPSRRAGIFFKNYLSSTYPTPLWSPKILTINEFIDSFDKKTTADNITLLFKIYNSYKQFNSNPVTFDEFMSWGEMLLSDFEDIDKYLVDPNQLYKNLVSYKEIETDYSFLDEEQIEAIQSFWRSFNPNKISDHQRSFLNNWELLHPIYNHFKETLSQEQLAYSGMQIRQLIERIKSNTPPEIAYPKVIFCGFFVLTPAEKELFKFVKKLGIGEFFWDYSEFILHDRFKDKLNYSGKLPFRDAGNFMRENIQAFPPPENWELQFNSESPIMTVTGVGSQSEQMRIVTQFLESNDVETTNKQPLETAIILTNENVLIQALHAIPETFDKINVSLGYPIKNTPIYNLVELIINLQRNSKTTKQGKTWFYFRDVLPIIQHQYISAIDEEVAKSIKKDMLKRNAIFIEASQLHKSDYYSFLFQKIENTGNIPEYISTILLRSYQLTKLKENTWFEQEYIFALYKSVNKLSHLLESIEENIKSDTWLKLFKRITQTQTIPFKGEPLSGLQVMGILETRALDFKNLIILNMNEGVFPKDSAPNTFIPYNLRKGYGLPTIEHQDAIFSYYFFRLIHRATNVQLVYNSSPDEMQSGEMSRFLYQLIYEHPAKPKLQTAIDLVTISQAPEVYTSKTKEVLEKLNQYLEKGKEKLSPSALSTYIECPLRFSFKYIHNIGEEVEITEDLDARIFGILFHWCMEELYKPWLNKVITKKELEILSKNTLLIKATLHQAFKSHFSELSLDSDEFIELQGKNILVFEVLLKYILKFLENDIQYAPIYIHGLEKNVKTLIAVDDSMKVRIGGIIDRLDEVDNVIRVMDYKTGGGKDKAPDIKSLFDTKKHKDTKAIFQTLLYSTIINESIDKTIEPSVVWLKSLYQKNDYSLKLGSRQQIDKIILGNVKDEFNDHLKELLNDIYNSEIPFKQTAEPKNCEYCTYKKLCNRL